MTSKRSSKTTKHGKRAKKPPAAFLRREIDAQRAANQSSAPYAASFAEHRRRLTARIVVGVPEGSEARLCLLGAGNCHDVDLPKLARHFRQVHLVDIDALALDRAVARQPEALRQRLVRHAPIDVGGMLDRLDRYQRLDVTPDELLRQPAAVAEDVTRRVGGPFDVVASTCMLTQLHLTVLEVLTDTHPLFRAVTQTLTLTHLKTLGRLTAAGGRAVLATEIVSNATTPLDTDGSDEDATRLFDACVARHDVIAVSHPELLLGTLRDDPQLSRDVTVGERAAPWLWQQAPERRFLVYAIELHARPRDGK